jgi:hypothetical protein
MAHVEAEDIHSAIDEFAYHFRRLSCGSEGDDEFGFTGHGE